MEVKTDLMLEVLQENSEFCELKGSPVVEPKEHVLSEETNNSEVCTVGEIDSGFIETTESEENTIITKDSGWNDEEELEDGEIRGIGGIKENSVSNYEIFRADGSEPPRKKIRKSGRKFTLVVTNASLKSMPEDIRRALEKVVGFGKVSVVSQIWKLQPASQSFTNVFCADVVDYETLKLLVELKPKLCMHGQELTIEENKIIRTRKSEKETRVVFISRIPNHACDEAIIRTALEAKVGRGNVLSVRCLKNRKTGLPLGSATAYCANVVTAKRLLLLHSKIKISGKRLYIVEYEKPNLGKKKPVTVQKLSFSNLPVPLKGGQFRSKILKLVGKIDFLEIEVPLVSEGSKLQGCAYVSLKSKDAAGILLNLAHALTLGGKVVKVQIHLEDDMCPSDRSNKQGRRIEGHAECMLSGKGPSVDYSRQASLSSNGSSSAYSVVSQDGRAMIDYGIGWEQMAFESVQKAFQNVRRAYGSARGSCNGGSSGSDHLNNVSRDSCSQKTHVSGESSSCNSDWEHQNHDNIYKAWSQNTCQCVCGRDPQGTHNVNRVGLRQRISESVPRTDLHINHVQNHQGHGSFGVVNSNRILYDSNNFSVGQNSKYASCYNSSNVGFVNQSHGHHGHDSFGRVDQRRRAYESVHGSNDFGHVDQRHLNHQGYNNFSRGAPRPRTSENVHGIDVVNVNQNWGHDNVSRPVRQGTYENIPHSHDGVNRTTLRQNPYESVHFNNNVSNVDEYAWGDQSYEWSDGYQNQEGYDFEE